MSDNKKENVNHPKHYASGKIEVIEAIEDWGLGMHRGNAVKYIARAGKKDPSKVTEDLEKAVWYLQRLIELQKAAAADRAPVRPNDMNKRQEPSQKQEPNQHILFIAEENLAKGDFCVVNPVTGQLRKWIGSKVSSKTEPRFNISEIGWAVDV